MKNWKQQEDDYLMMKIINCNLVYIDFIYFFSVYSYSYMFKTIDSAT